MSLSERMHQEKRIKEKYSKVAKAWEIPKDDKRMIGKIISTHGKSCSCYACGNPRKNYPQKTLKEITSEKNFKKDLENL